MSGNYPWIMSGNYPWIMSGNYPWIMSGNYPLVYYDDAEKLRFIGILAYPKMRLHNVSIHIFFFIKIGS